MSAQGTHRVVVVGGGFGGLQAVQKLRRAPVEVTLIDRRNFHLFQPLTYQVATGALSPGEIAYPLRAIFKRYRNVKVLLAEVSDIDLDARQVHLAQVDEVPAPPTVPYDTLIVAGGSAYSYFGHDDWREYAAEVKSLESAIAVRGQHPHRVRGGRMGDRPGPPCRVADVRGGRGGADRRGDGRPDRGARARHPAPRLRHGRPTDRPDPADRGRRSSADDVPAVAVAEGAALARAARRDADARCHRGGYRRRVRDRRHRRAATPSAFPRGLSCGPPA